MDSDIERASMRANMVEEKLFELKVSTLETAKKNAAMDIRKAQNEMKKRLRRIRDRQREIYRSKPAQPTTESIGFASRPSTKSSARPKTSHAQRSKSVSATHSKRPKSVMAASEADAAEVELDPSFFTDQQRSKIDLRPSTASGLSRNGLLKLISTGRLGTPVAQIRYFDEDELRDRGLFYLHVVESRKIQEQRSFTSLDVRVTDFCSKSNPDTGGKISQSRLASRLAGDVQKSSAHLSDTTSGLTISSPNTARDAVITPPLRRDTSIRASTAPPKRETTTRLPPARPSSRVS
jgi:hypothetical protein